jgi:16S rRNA (guanine966-N2)-methyltransferase
MRVIGGSARSVPLLTVPDDGTRPILDRLKKSLFSILDSAGLLADTRAMDLYSGCGTLGIEALSRGARYCLFAELRADCVELLKKNLEKTRLADRADVRRGEVASILRNLAPVGSEVTDEKRIDLILYDPPFVFSREKNSRAGLEMELAAAGRLLTAEGRLVLRCERITEPPQPAGLTLARHWQDGPHALCFFARQEPAR